MPHGTSSPEFADRIDLAPDAPSPQSTTLFAPLPACPSPRLEPRRISFVMGLLGTWFVPRRTGPHLAAGSWTAAVVAHLLGLLAAGILLPLLLLRAVPDQPPGELVGALIQGGDPARQLLADYFGSLLNLFRGFLALLAFEASLVAAGVVLMPWAAAGEAPRALFTRCLKWVLWVTSLSLPTFACAHLAISLETWFQGRSFSALMYDRGPFGVPLFVLVTYACCAWLLLVLFRGLLDFAGPPEGPGWQTIEPICEGCGYHLAHQRVSGVCPECAKPVRQSLPGGDRVPPQRSGRQLEHPSPVGFLWRLFSAGPLRTVSPRYATSHARRFCVFSLLLCAAPLHLVMPIVFLVTTTGPDGSVPWIDAAVLSLVFGATFTAVTLKAAGLGWIVCFLAGWLQDRQRDPRVSATAALYCTGLWLVPVAYAVLALAGLVLLHEALENTPWADLHRQRVLMNMRLGEYYPLAQFFIGMLWVLWLALRMRHHLRDVRYSNS